MGNVVSASTSKFRARADALIEQARKLESGSDAQRSAMSDIQRLLAQQPQCIFDKSGAHNIFLALSELGDVNSLAIALIIAKCAMTRLSSQCSSPFVIGLYAAAHIIHAVSLSSFGLFCTLSLCRMCCRAGAGYPCVIPRVLSHECTA